MLVKLRQLINFSTRRPLYLPISNFQGRQMSSKSFETFEEQDIRKFYDEFTSRSVTNLRNALYTTYGKKNTWCFSLETMKDNHYISKISSDEKVDKDGHTKYTFIHSMQVLSSIKKMGFQDWKKYSIKMGYPFCLESFYMIGMTNLPFTIISTKFTNDNKLIKSLSEDLNNENIPLNERNKMLNSKLKNFISEDKRIESLLTGKQRFIF